MVDMHTEHADGANHLETLPTIKEQQTVPTNVSLQRSTTSQGASSRLYGVRSALGLHAQAPIDEEHDEQVQDHLLWPRIRLALREPFAEFWGVFIMVAFGDASVAQVLLSEHIPGPGGKGFGEYQSISWGWGLGVMLGIYTAGDSGAYLNPAITFTNCILRGLPWRRFPIYLLAQFLGGFVASGVVYANYITAIDSYAGVGVRTVPPEFTATGQIFCTYPQAFLEKGNQFFSEFITSTLLMFCIYALKDKSNSGGIRGDANWFPLGLFFLIFGLGACWGFETGYAINLARDFGPRIMSVIVGYEHAFSAGDYYFWVPLVASFTGCLFGGLLYDIFIYTGPESPINSPYMGLPYLFRPDRAIKARWHERDPEIPPPITQQFVDSDTRNQKATGKV